MQALIVQASARRRLALTALFIGTTWLAVPAAYAEPAAHKTHHARPAVVQPTSGNYVSVKEIPTLPAPPSAKSHTARADIKQIIGIQTYAAPEETAAARDEQNLRPEHLVGVIDITVSQAELPLTFALLERVGTDVGVVTRAAKKRWHTVRPYRLDRRIKLLVDPLPADDYGYPSGHTSISYVWARILAELDPAAATLLLLQADRIAGHRVLAGVHTAHDIAGGKKLGTEIFAVLKDKPAFQTDLAAARTEFDAWRAATAPSGRKNWKSFKSRITE